MSPHSFFSKRAFKEVKDIFTTANSIKPRRSNSCSPLRGSQPTYRSITSSPRTSRTSKTSRYGITSRSTSESHSNSPYHVLLQGTDYETDNLPGSAERY